MTTILMKLLDHEKTKMRLKPCCGAKKVLLIFFSDFPRKKISR